MAHSPSRFRSLCGVRAVLAATALLVAAPAAPGGAVPITETLFFTGPGGYGVSGTEATASGLPILSPPLATIDGFETTRELDPLSIRLGPPGRASSDWTVANQRGVDLVGDVYLLFVRPLENEVDLGNRTETVDYDPADVGLTLRNEAGGLDWVLLQGFDPVLGNLYYPAVSLGSLLDGETSAAFRVDYVLEDPERFLNSDALFELGLPAWQIGSAFVPIPEPATGLLVGGGLAALALGRRRRS